MHGGAADRSGLIHVGDEVCEVNGISVEGKTPSFVLHILVGETFFHIVTIKYDKQKSSKKNDIFQSEFLRPETTRIRMC